MEEGFDRSLTISKFEPTAGSDWPYSYKILIAEVSWKTAGVSRKIQVPAIMHKGNN